MKYSHDKKTISQISTVPVPLGHKELERTKAKSHNNKITSPFRTSQTLTKEARARQRLSQKSKK